MCAGAIHTPHLLSLSGIGRAQQLRQYGLDVAADLPGVGRNLQVPSVSSLPARACWSAHKPAEPICSASK